MVKKIASKSSGNAITNFIRSEITAPEKRAGNTSIAISVTVFGLAVTFLRSLGDMLGKERFWAEEEDYDWKLEKRTGYNLRKEEEI
ncbi:hypothetical protein BGZ47_008050 [Haplosporangium gracile]|nr:hypothetical protein BGZ47_008050 [Haplosporangium gracile]